MKLSCCLRRVQNIIYLNQPAKLPYLFMWQAEDIECDGEWEWPTDSLGKKMAQLENTLRCSMCKKQQLIKSSIPYTYNYFV